MLAPLSMRKLASRDRSVDAYRKRDRASKEAHLPRRGIREGGRSSFGIFSFGKEGETSASEARKASGKLPIAARLTSRTSARGGMANEYHPRPWI